MNSEKSFFLAAVLLVITDGGMRLTGLGSVSAQIVAVTIPFLLYGFLKAAAPLRLSEERAVILTAAFSVLLKSSETFAAEVNVTSCELAFQNCAAFGSSAGAASFVPFVVFAALKLNQEFLCSGDEPAFANDEG